MPAPATPEDNFVSKLVRAAKSDPKKAGVLTVLVAVLATMWARMAMNGGAGPAGAEAAVVAKSDNGLSPGGSQAGRTPGPSAASVAATVSPMRPSPPITAGPASAGCPGS